MISRIRLVSALAVALSSLSTISLARADEVEECAAAAENGQELRDQGKLVEARERIVRCSQSSCPKMVRSDCEKWLPEVEARIPTVVLHAAGEGGGDLAAVKVERNGAAWLDKLDGSAIQMNPGANKLRFTAEGYDPIDKEIVVAEGQHGRIVEIKLTKTGGAPVMPGATPAEPTKADEGAGPGLLPWVVLGVGVAGLGTFTVTQILASSDVSSVEDGCGATKTCSDAELDPIRTKLTISAIGLGVGIAGVGASIAMFALLSGDKGDDAAAIRLVPVVGPTTAAAFVDVPISF